MEPSAVADAASVRATYDRIADHFSRTRAHPWPQIPSFLDGRSGVVGVALGCGNGRHVELLADCCDRAVGLDLSRELLGVAVERATDYDADWVQGSVDRLPFAADSVDIGVYIATLHHLDSQATRRASLDELARVLAPGGRALVSVWSTTHSTFDETEGFDTVVDWTLPGGDTVPRYYHIYDPDEFERDLAASDLAVERTFTGDGNCFAVVGCEGKRT
ncbi:methyltransferase domain-containing protein [Halosegnis longus]|uniref:methyltransferase domain-containing protein n=1 Tax=Halosegnis longus TaxID=2216012 RepID=UPI00096AB3EB|nr:class I SAM-dependent methyltransferase [Salella cibi]